MNTEAIALPITAAILAGLTVFAVRAYKSYQARRARNLAIATKRGWRTLGDAGHLVDMFKTQPFGDGLSRKVQEAVTGSYREREFTAFIYRYETQTVDGKGMPRRQVHLFEVVAITVAGHLPVVRFTPETVFARMAKAFGGRDVEVESAAFNRSWRVWTTDERTAHGMLAPHVIDWLLRPDVLQMPFVFEPGYLMTYETGVLELNRAIAKMDRMCEFVGLIPAFVFEDRT